MSRAVIGSLRVELEAATAKFREGFASAGKEVSGLSDRLSGFGQRLLPVSGAVAGVGAALAGLIRSTANTGDSIAKTAREAGLTGEAWQELGFVMGHIAQISDQQLATAFGTLTQRIGDAQSGQQQYIDVLEQLGFSQDQIASGAIDTETAFAALTDAIRAAESPAIAASLAADLLGERAGRKLAGALLESGDQIDTLRQQARDMGIVMSDDATAASEAFNDAMSNLGQELAALGRDIGTQLIPVVVNDLIPVFRDRVVPAIRTVTEWVSKAISWFADLPAPIQEAGLLIGAVLGSAGPILIGIGLVSKALTALIAASGPIGLTIAAVGLVVAAWRNWDEITAIVGRVVDGVREWLVGRLGAIFDSVKGKIDAVTGWFSGMFDAVVGGSFVPDMVDGIASHFGRLGEVMVAPTQSATEAITGIFDGWTEGLMAKIGGAFGEGGLMSSIMSTGLSALGGVMTGGLTAIMGSLGGIAMSGLRKIGGFFKGLFGGPSAKELAGREIVENFQHNVASMLDETQRIKAGGELWRQVNVGVVDSYIEMGLSEQQALDDLGALYAAIEAGPDRVNPALQRIQDRMAGLDQSILDTSGSLDALTRPRQINIGFNLPEMSGFSVPGFAGGTGGEYGQFDPSGTLAMLHGDEAITPRAAVPALARDIAAAMGGGGMGGDIYIAVADGGAQRLSRSQFRQFERAAQGGLVRIPASAIGDQG